LALLQKFINGVIRAEPLESGNVVVAIDRPPVNALDLDCVFALNQAFAALANDPPQAAILTGLGKAFSAGVDVQAWASYDAAARRRMAREITAMTAAIAALPCPLVAAINGHALGGGFVLVLCCDYRLASDHSAIKLGLPEVSAGIPFPEGPVRIIRHELPPQLLRSLTLTGAASAPSRFLEAGIIDELCAPEDLLARADQAASRLAGLAGYAVVKDQLKAGLRAELASLVQQGD
jgi:enoyl-CoA hydratase